ncbi:MAG: hypothetical protein ACK2T3_10345 [Candidatus Promineifilaceae bacterium]
MYYLAILFPVLKRIRLPLTRDQLMLLMAAINLLFLAFDIYLAHNLNGTIRTREWIPIVFGTVAGVLLLFCGLIAFRWRRTASIIATAILFVSIMVGILGAYFHVVRATLPTAPLGERVSIALLVWAPPIVGPLIFSLVGLWGVSAAWIEDPPDSGRLFLVGDRRLQLPLSKTRAFLFMVSLGTLATLISSVLDHGRAEFKNPWLWIPIAVGVFATVVAAGLGSLPQPSKADILIYLIAMALLIAVGAVGFWLHIKFDLTSRSEIVIERFLRGAPFLAPLLFANMGLVGVIALLDPSES